MKINSMIMAAALLGWVSVPAARAVNVGDAVPDVAVSSTSGETVNLRDVPGWKVVYFYPKSFTGGCTRQACGMRDSIAEYEDLEARVFGVSTDSIDTQNRFKQEYQLSFDLLADDQKTLSEAFDVLGPAGLSKRVTFIIDPEGVITDVIEAVSVGTHDRDIAEMLAARQETE